MFIEKKFKKIIKFFLFVTLIIFYKISIAATPSFETLDWKSNLKKCSSVPIVFNEIDVLSLQNQDRYYFHNCYEERLTQVHLPMVFGDVGDNLYYQGEWLNDRPHGLGVMIYNNGSYTYGNYRNGVLHGEGVFYSEGVCTYEAQYIHGYMNGAFTTKECKDFNKFEGYSFLGNYYGQGILDNGKNIWKGFFIGSDLNGLGSIEVIDRTTCSIKGYFLDGNLHGQGELFNCPKINKHSEDKVKGIYSFGRLVRGETYFSNNRLRSKGTFYNNFLFNGFTYIDGVEKRYLNGKN